jgi:hypothetical protein
LPSGLREVISNISSKRVTREEVAVAMTLLNVVFCFGFGWRDFCVSENDYLMC